MGHKTVVIVPAPPSRPARTVPIPILNLRTKKPHRGSGRAAVHAPARVLTLPPCPTQEPVGRLHRFQLLVPICAGPTPAGTGEPFALPQRRLELRPGVSDVTHKQGCQLTVQAELSSLISDHWCQSPASSMARKEDPVCPRRPLRSPGPRPILGLSDAACRQLSLLCPHRALLRADQSVPGGWAEGCHLVLSGDGLQPFWSEPLVGFRIGDRLGRILATHKA